MKTIKFTSAKCCFLTALFLTFVLSNSIAQLTVINPSFEGTPQAHVVPAHLAHGDYLGPCISWNSSTEDIKNEAILEAYPNPLTDITTIIFSLPTNEKAIISIDDLSGKQITVLFENEIEANKVYILEFHGGNLSNGVYLYRLKTQTRIYTKKLVVLHK